MPNTPLNSRSKSFRLNPLCGAMAIALLAGCHRTPPASTTPNQGKTPNARPAPTVKMTVPQALGVDILRSLNQNSGLKNHRISVGTDSTSVTLNGEVKTAAQKQLAERIARQQAKGYKVTNHLKIAEK